jgi:hypothetical protein
MVVSRGKRDEERRIVRGRADRNERGRSGRVRTAHKRPSWADLDAMKGCESSYMRRA